MSNERLGGDEWRSAESFGQPCVSSTGGFRCNRDLRYVSANPAYAQLIGLPIEQIIGRPIAEVIGKAAFEIIRPLVERVLRGEQVEYEDEVSIAESRRSLHVVYTPVGDASGNVVGWVASIMDISESKRAEEAVRRQADLLRLSFDAMIVFRLDGGIESWNQGAETLYGFTEREAIGQRPLELLRTVHSVSRSAIEAVLKDQGNWEGELQHRTKDGRQVTVSARLQLITGSDGVARVLEINRDITGRKRMEEERAQEARRKDEFLSFLGHELRNPLAAISTAIQVLSGAVSAKQRASLNETMDRQLMLMRRLLDDLLDLGRITHGHIELKKERIDLAKFLKQATADAEQTAAERRQQVILHLPAEAVAFKADEVRLEQIVLNLLNNASKYTPQRGRIELSGAREGSEIVLRCKDNGRGILPEMQKNIFEPFTRVGPLNDSHGEASLGIGLALVKRLVELHDGTVSVESDGPGMGSEFTVRLPLVDASADQTAVPEAMPVPRLRCARSIVVVEDNPDVSKVMVAALQQAGYQVSLFADAPSTLAGLSSLTPHAVLLDVGLPGMDGCELATELKKMQHLRQTLFVGLSGFKKPECGGDFDYYFNKPVDLRALVTLLDKLALPREVEGATEHRAFAKSKLLRVLLIEDHAGLSAATAQLLRTEGFEVRTALSGGEGLEVAPVFKPQLTLCDLNLPDVGGLEVIRRLRSNPVTRHTHAVILTALSNDEIRVFNGEAKRLSIDKFICKPITIEAIRALAASLSGNNTSSQNGTEQFGK